MALRFTDAHAMALVAPHLFPGEQVLFRARGVEKPWYSRLFARIGAFMWRYWLVVGTNQRLVFVQHGGLLSGYSSKRAEAFGWGEIDKVDLGWGVFNKNLVVRSAGKSLARTVIIPRGWMRGNFDAAKGMVTQHQQAQKSLPAGGSVPYLGAPPQYGTA